LIFPFEPDTPWIITQGYATTSTHGATFLDEKYAFDLQVAEKTNGGYQPRPAKTAGKTVLAAAKGSVVWAQRDKQGTGIEDGGVLLRHDDYTEDLGNGQKKYYFTMYLHMQKIWVKAGDQVTQGTPIGEAGAVSSRYQSMSPHIHFHLLSSSLSNGEGQRNPEPFLNLQGWVVRDSQKQENYAKTTWPHSGETNQYSNWVVSRARLTPGLPSVGTAGTATILVLDISGSMGDPWKDGIKIESAKKAAQQFLNMLEAESRVGQVSHQVAIVTFSSDASLNLSLTSDYARAKTLVASLQPTAQTNIGAAIQTANAELRRVSGNPKKIIVLLTDGMTNVGIPRDQILSGPVAEATQAGTCIYTIGFGEPGDLDQAFLRQVAQASQCGQYYYGAAGFELQGLYIKVRHESTGTVIGEFAGQVRQGETVSAGQVEVKPQQAELRATLNWPGSKLALVVKDPQGRRVDSAYPGVTIFTEGSLVYIIVKDPVAGLWQMAVVGQEVPGGSTDYRVVVSTVQGSAPQLVIHQAVVAFLGLIVLGLTVGLVVVASRRPAAYGQPTAAPRGAGLRVVDGPLAGTFVPFRGGMLTIGRRQGNTLILPDPQVSGNHAHLVAVPGGLAIYDRNSANGTFVNGQRVPAASLRPGDEIRIGTTRLRFEVYG